MPPAPDRERTRRRIGALQALRLALFQHMFLRVVMIPPFSRANDIAREDVWEMVFTLRIDEAVAQLRRAFPVSFPSISDFAIAEPTDYPDEGATGYAAIQRDYIDTNRTGQCPGAADRHGHRQRIRRPARAAGTAAPGQSQGPGLRRFLPIRAGWCRDSGGTRC